MKMYRPQLEELQQYKEQYSVVPVSREIFADIKTPIAVLKSLKAVSSCAYLLESVEGGEKWGRYSFLGFNPSTEIKCRNGEMTITGATTVKFATQEPEQHIRRILSEYKSPRLDYLPPFTGGLVGYFAYEYARYAEPEKLNFTAVNDEASVNDIDLMLFDQVIAFDHLRQKIILIVNIKTDELEKNYLKAQLDIDYLADLVRRPIENSEPAGKLLSEFTSEFSETEYAELVKKAKHYITEGDIFQVVPSNRREAEFSGSLLNAYRVLRTTNPSPYMFYFSGHDVEMTGASPETLVKLHDGELSTFPIAGTTRRGRTTAEDKALEKSLLADEKELAEHNMLVDLGRNDLGKISKFGTVKVRDFQKIERFSHVMHITSTVQSEISEEYDALDAVRATLPAGTLSGAPKIRAMEIINELEKSPRGIYGGAIGYIDFTGNMDVCIGIRMAVRKNGRVYVRSGGGVVADSEPASEYQETVNKAQAMIDAIKLAQEVAE